MLCYVIFEQICVPVKMFKMPNWRSLLVMLVYVKSNIQRNFLLVVTIVQRKLFNYRK